MQNDDISDLNGQIAKNLKEIRKKRNLSLEALSNLCGVSKSMLGQIERGDSSPTITTLWKIATSLHISFTSLLEDSSKEIKVVDNYDITPLLNDEGRFRLYPTFPFDSTKNFEMFYIELDPHTYTQSEPHEANTMEYVIVYEGDITILIGEEEYLVSKAQSIKYDADIKHGYLNKTDYPAKMCMLIYYE